MKIVHLCLCSFFPDNYSYQENLLPKYHKRLGYDVEVIDYVNDKVVISSNSSDTNCPTEY